MFAGGAVADKGPARGAMQARRLQEVADGIHVYLQPDGSCCLSNAGIVVGPRSVLLIDTASPEPRARALRAAIGTLTSRPAATLVNTHHPGRHTYRNFLFPPATI